MARKTDSAEFDAQLRTLLQAREQQVRDEALTQGRLEATRAALLAILQARGFPARNEYKRCIDACLDLDLLQTWIRRAATASAISGAMGNPGEVSKLARSSKLQRAS